MSSLHASKSTFQLPDESARRRRFTIILVGMILRRFTNLLYAATTPASRFVRSGHSVPRWQRHASTAPSNAGLGTAQSTESSSKRGAPLSEEQRQFLDSALRVNQAGELAATLIYTAQTPPLVKAHPNLQPLMKHMYDQEAGHFATFNKLLAKHRIRPTALYPVWQVAASVLGWTTAMMGREAAMACTEAIETEIGNHYNGQVRELFQWMQDLKENGQEIDPELMELIDNIKTIRDEELEHLDHAVDNDAKEAQPYEPLTNVIRYGCRGAIWITERV